MHYVLSTYICDETSLRLVIFVTKDIYLFYDSVLCLELSEGTQLIPTSFQQEY